MIEFSFCETFNIEEFLSLNPGFLLQYKHNNTPFPQVAQDMCKWYDISQLLLLTFLQYRSGLIFRSVRPSQASLNFCLGIKPFRISETSRLKVNVFGALNQVESLLFLLSKFRSEGDNCKGSPVWVDRASYFIPESVGAYMIISVFALNSWGSAEYSRFKESYKRLFGCYDVALREGK
jgi:hypothetical protein